MSVCIIDVEGSGFPGHKLSSVIELGAVVVNESGNEIAGFNCLVKPLYGLGSWAQSALEVNGIDPALLKDAPPAEEVWGAFLEWLALHKPLHQVLAFNVSYDKPMMEKTFKQARHLPWGPCLMRDTNEVLFGKRNGLKLNVAAEALGIPVAEGKMHRAYYDASLAGKVYAAMKQRAV